MNPQDRPARRFDEPPAYEDRGHFSVMERTTGHIASSWGTRDDALRAAVREAHDGGEWAVVRWGEQPSDNDVVVFLRRDPDIAARSHLGAIVIVAAIVGLALIAVALLVRGAG